MLKILFNYFIFPGFIFLSILGMFVSWVDRKVTARVQWRLGPPILQPFYDLRKLLLKETIIPKQGNTLLFVLSPVLSLLSVILVSNILVLTYLYPQRSFMGDMIVVIYLLLIPALTTIIGASASFNPLSSLGASREIKLILSYELPFILALLVPIIRSHSILLGDIIRFQQSSGSFASSLSGMLAFAVALLCMHAKIGLVPFDLAEAETELAGGVSIEYSGPLLAFWKLSKMMMLIVAPVFLIVAFLAGGGITGFIIKFLLITVAFILIKNTNPRVRIDQAMRFFWGPVAILGFVSVLLALMGF
ncbi:MAG: NADH-quinone oxidoreductase subunit H [Elusimicrobia bacterium]|nr:NADH-quinone oxidoreductase subunit H [Candidatus Liberimonas magnetica]